MAAEFGAGYGRMTPVLEEMFDEAIGFEREADLIELHRELPSPARLINVERLAKVPAPNGAFSFCFICTVLQHMLDEEVKATLTEMRRVADGGFILLIEDVGSQVQGNYGPDSVFTKGRTLEAYQGLMAPWELDFAKPRHMGGLAGYIWGQFMMFRAPGVPSVETMFSGAWASEELRL